MDEPRDWLPTLSWFEHWVSFTGIALSIAFLVYMATQYGAAPRSRLKWSMAAVFVAYALNDAGLAMPRLLAGRYDVVPSLLSMLSWLLLGVAIVSVVLALRAERLRLFGTEEEREARAAGREARSVEREKNSILREDAAQERESRAQARHAAESPDA